MSTLVPSRQLGSVPSTRAGAVTIVPSVGAGPLLLLLGAPANGPQGVNNSLTIQLANADGSFILQGGVVVTISLIMGDGTLGGTLSGPTNGGGQVTLNAWNISRAGPTANNLHMLRATASGYAPLSTPFFEVWAGRLDSTFGGTKVACGLVATRALATYGGNLIDLYRLSDMAVQGFGCAYGSDFLDEAAIGVWLGVGIASIATLYDNTANANNMKPTSGIPGTQGDAGGPYYRPVGIGGRPDGDLSVTLPGLPRLERPSSVAAMATYAYSVYTLWQVNDITANRSLWNWTDTQSNQNYRTHAVLSTSGFDQAQERHNATPVQAATGSSNRSGAPRVFEGRWNSDVSRSTTVDGDEATDAGDSNGPPDAAFPRVSIGRRLLFSGSSYISDGYFVGWCEVDSPVALTNAERNSYGEAFAADRGLTWTPLP